MITTTTHARSYALHTLVWAHAADRELDQAAAVDLLRRCEVVLAGVTMQHEQHLAWIPLPHGNDAIRKRIDQDGLLDVTGAAAGYSTNAWGFGGVYLGSEAQLGLVANGRPPTAGPRADFALLREGLGGILELAGQETVDLSTLASAPELCACAARQCPDGPWLRAVLVRPDLIDELEGADRARRQTAQLLGRVLESGSDIPPQDVFQRQLAFGDFIETDGVASGLPIALAWRGAILRNYSVGAWRRIWSWLVGLLAEPETVASLGEQLAAALPEMTVGEMIAGLPERLDGGVLLPAEYDLRHAHWSPDPFTEIQLLALGALRLADLKGPALRAFAGREDDDDLGPGWFAAQLDARKGDSLHDFGRWLAEMMVLRAQRVALTKMDYTPSTGRFWIPSRIRERAGLISRLSTEGWNDVGLRIDTLSSVLSGCGVIERDPDGAWRVTEEGDALLA